MALFGPFTGVAGTVLECDIEQDAQAIYVRNTSRFDLAISLESGKPSPTTTFGGRPWNVVVRTALTA